MPASRLISRAAVVVAGTMLALPAGAAGAQTAPAPTGWNAPGRRVDLRVLVVTDGTPWVEAIRAQLDREAVPTTVVNLLDPSRPTIDDAFLQDVLPSGPRSRFQAVVLPNANPFGATGELDAVHRLAREFGVRTMSAYVWPGPSTGTGWPVWWGALDGRTVTLSPSAVRGTFSYLRGSLTVEDNDPAVIETWGSVAVPLPPDPATGSGFEPLLTTTVTTPDGTVVDGVLAGVHRTDGREELVTTFAFNGHQSHLLVLAPGFTRWLTRGIRLGYQRNYLSVHVDDVFLPDDRWSIDGDCTVGDDCNPDRDPSVWPYNEPIRMTPEDVTALLAWQQANGIKLDLAFNGAGSEEAKAANGGVDPLTDALLAARNQLRWINHTWSHPYLGCVQDFSVVPWRCATDPATGQVQWASGALIEQEILTNVRWARNLGITVNSRELVTGEHSGLRSLPQMPDDNPNLAPALARRGVTVLASDASREPAPRTVGTARTVPRHPMNIFYNVGTVAEQVDEYNWIYTSSADGGSGLCEIFWQVTTCIEPLDLETGFADHIVPLEASIAFGHVVTDDPRPHYAHQSNLTEDRVLYPVLDTLLARYRATFAANTPLVNPTMREASLALERDDRWAAANANVEAYLLDGVVHVVNHGAPVEVPTTMPLRTRVVSATGAVGILYGRTYAGERSRWTLLPTGGVLRLLPAA